MEEGGKKMELPVTKYAVVGVFSVVFIIAIDALPPMEIFYEVYTKHIEEVTSVIDKAMHPMFQEANDALCRCVIERTGINVPRNDESIEAFISEAEVYNFLYDKPRYNIGTNLIACLRNQKYTKLYIAFSSSEDEFFYVQVSKTSPKTARVHNMFRIAGLNDNDQKMLSESPYWCRVTVETYLELAAFTSKKSNIAAKMTKKEKESHSNSRFQSKINSNKKISGKGPSSDIDRGKESRSSYLDHTAAQTWQQLVAHNENSGNQLATMRKEERPSNKQPVVSILKKREKPVKNTTYEGLSNDNNWGKQLQNDYGSHTTAKLHHASATQTMKQSNIVARDAREKMPAYYTVPKTNKESDKKASGERPLYDNNKEKLSHGAYLSRSAAETSHSSVKHCKTINNIVEKFPKKQRPSFKLPLTYMLQNNNDSDEETSDKKRSYYNDWENLSQNPYLCRDATKPSHASLAHSKKKSNIVTKKRPSYKQPLVPVMGKQHNSEEEEDEDASYDEGPPNESPLSTKPSKGYEIENDDECSDGEQRQLNGNDGGKRSHTPYLCRTSAEKCHASAVHSKKKNDIVAEISKEKRPSSYKLSYATGLQRNNDSSDGGETTDEERANDNDREYMAGNAYRSRTATETSYALAAAYPKKENDIVDKMAQKKRPLRKSDFTSVTKTNNDSEAYVSNEEPPSNDNERKKQSENTTTTTSWRRSSAEPGHTSAEPGRTTTTTSWRRTSAEPGPTSAEPGRTTTATSWRRTSAEPGRTSVEHNKTKSADIVATFTNKKRLLYSPPITDVPKNDNDSDEDSSEERQSIKRLPIKPSKGPIEVESDESLEANEQPSNGRIPMKPSRGPIQIESEESSED